MSVPPDAVARAFRCFGEKRYAEAERLCCEVLGASPADATALHLLGLICKESGDAAGGEHLIRQSIALEPRRAEFQANLGNLQRRQGQLEAAVVSYRGALGIDAQHRAARLGLARTLKDLGRQTEVEAECRILLSANPQDAESWCTLAVCLRQQSRHAEAESAYRAALAIQPGYGVAHHNLGALLTELDRVEEGLAAIETAERIAGVSRESAINRGHALLKLNRLQEAEQAYAQAVESSPQNVEAQVSLAKLRFMCGDPQFSRDLAAAAAAFPAVIALQFSLSDVLRRSGDLLGAEGLLRDLLARHGPQFGLHCALASLLHEQGLFAAAEHAAQQAVAAMPDNAAGIETLIAIQLSLGRADRAMPMIERQRQREPLQQQWIAYWLTAARVLNDSLHDELSELRGLIRCYEIEPSAAQWPSLAALNTAAADVLYKRHRFSRQPLDQSLRHGSQTSRSLMSEPDVAIQSILQAFQQPLRDYSRELDQAGRRWLQRPGRGEPVIKKCWSVLLGPGGFHVPHIHPEGWISSAYYVHVPDEVQDATAMPGWIKFGEPSFPVPGCAAERFIQPRPGLLLLFPSFMWHGTHPIKGTEPRLTIAFDAVPQS